MTKITLDYLLREKYVGIYDAQWHIILEKLIHYICLSGQAFKEDAEMLYNIFVQYVATIGVWGNIIARHKSFNNVRKFYLHLKGHFQTESYEKNKAHKALDTTQNAHFDGNRIFLLGNYYSVLVRLFMFIGTNIPYIPFVLTTPNRTRLEHIGT